ncbi:MAG: hypothetical protein CL693_10775 [Cellvibrionaceae bacterium]|nr:hypothetical protein [Cellvibrionaceae bacterium]|tara:strand:+ start:17802 stop:18185 length:384 start_codon:yes stop_codon:yes gene_type:complete
MNDVGTAECSTTQLEALNQQVDLYQSVALDDNSTFGISSLQNLELATVRYHERLENSYWAVETRVLSVREAESLAADLHHQHFQFYIRNGCFHVIAWNLLDAHYICNLIALNDLGLDLHQDPQSEAA